MTRLEENTNIYTKEGKLAVADQKHLSAKAYIAHITTEVKNNWQESVRKLV